MKTVLCYEDLSTRGRDPATDARYPVDVRWAHVENTEDRHRGARESPVLAFEQRLFTYAEERCSTRSQGYLVMIPHSGERA